MSGLGSSRPSLGPVSGTLELLCLNDGLLWGIVAQYFGLLGFSGPTTLGELEGLTLGGSKCRMRPPEP